MIRSLAAVLLVLALAACTTSVAPPSVTPTVTPSVSPEPTAEPTESPAPEEPTQTPLPQPEGHPADGLAFIRPGGPDSPITQVFVVEADGSLRQVTGLTGALGASHPAWSPDRSMIAFGEPKVGSTGVSGQIGLVNADGTNERKVGEGAHLQWSPDGSRIVFEEVDDVTSEPHSMYLLDVATGEITDLGIGFTPRWLPDGERISFHRMVEGRVEGEPGAFTDVLYVMSLDGGEPEELAVDTNAYWSPDGTEVLLVREGVISLAEADGSNARELVNGYDPVWSPDGSRIVFAYDFNQDALPILALVDRDGDEIWSSVVGSSPVWSPDGTRVAVEIAYPELLVQVLDAESGEVLWEMEGSEPAW